MAISRRHRMAPVSVLVFDLDHFKAINDKNGHATGDAMLQLFAKTARETLRATDIVGRLGGEEFVALLPSTAVEAAVAAERVRAAFAVASIARDGRRIAATVSIGVASASPATSIDLLITHADDALYRAKGNGRNRVEVASEPAETPAANQDQAAGAPRKRGRKEEGAVVDGALEAAPHSNSARIFAHLRVPTCKMRLLPMRSGALMRSSTFRTRPGAACARSE
jgi:diguanylate cyclase (GGDEF)-like protein